VISAGGSAEAAEVDALDEHAVDGHLRSVIDKAGRVDISLNAVGMPNGKILGASQALSLADAFRPQVAILDIGLPALDGYSLARELRARLGSSAPLMIALTGYGQDQDKRRSEEAGFTLHLVKPVDAETLVYGLSALVGGAS
jgi:CheY-like chemotaxis protein